MTKKYFLNNVGEVMGNNINTIIFDMYGVILEESKGRFIPYTFEHFDKSVHENLKRLFKEEQLFTKAGNGELTSDEFLSLLGYEDTKFHVKNYIENYLTLDNGFIDFAEKFYQKYNFVLLSNDVSEWSTYITEYYNLNKYFKHKIVSGDCKCRKPESEIYKLTLEIIGKNGEECVFIDNSIKNLAAASKFGIYTILFNRDGEEYDGIVVNNFKELKKILGCV